MNQRVRIGKEIIVDDVVHEEICQHVDAIIKNERYSPHFIFAQNIHKVLMARENSELLTALESAEILIPDGIAIIIAAKFLIGVKLRKRVTGTDLMEKLTELSSIRGYSVYLLGGKPGVAEQAANNLKNKYPKLEIAGTMHGYFPRENEDAVIENINATSPDLLFVGMGSPMQELLLYRNRDKIKVPFCMGVGGSLDVFAGKAKRAPEIFLKLELEGIYRSLTDIGILKRSLSEYPRYLFLILGYKLRDLLKLKTDAIL